jgi:5-methylcytosine-specific restriction endonuclease McrA
MARPKVHPNTIARIRREVFSRDEFTCKACDWTAIVPDEWAGRYTISGTNAAGKWVYLELDHVLPYSLGGPFTVSNLQTLCNRCNAKKGARV